MFTTKCLTVSCFSFLLLLLATQIESRTAPSHHTLHVGSDNIPRASSIGHHHHHTTQDGKHPTSRSDDPVEELAMKAPAAGAEGSDDVAHQLVKRSTGAAISVGKGNTDVTIDWKSLMVTLSEMIHKLFEFLSNTFKKLQERLMQAFVPFYPSTDRLGNPAVATSASVDLRSAATTLFNTLVKFQHLRKNEVW